MNLDRLALVGPVETLRAVFGLLDFNQSFRPEAQVAAAGVLFTALCDELGIDPSQLIDASRRRMRDHQDIVHAREVNSLRAYIRGEIAR